MRLTTSPRELVQTLLKDGVEHYSDQLARIAKQPPHILVTTPKALDDCWSKGKQLFTLDSVSTVVLEEADSLLRIPSNNTPPEVQKRWRKHPPVVRELLAEIFKTRPKHGVIRNDDAQPRHTSSPHPRGPVQMVLVSATLRPAVRKFLFLETKWLAQEPGQTLQIEGTKETDRRRDPVRHYGLFVDVSGSIRNLRDPDEDEDLEFTNDIALSPTAEEEDETTEQDTDELDAERPGKDVPLIAETAPETCQWSSLPQLFIPTD
jgi:superfamily II DNA/RNA helicase